ncbi:MAG: phosphatase PAP2 family protein [Pseudonocardia sp.]|nr:phosphatase PAP2 family protein [Pseudonocardia sp.]
MPARRLLLLAVPVVLVLGGLAVWLVYAAATGTGPSEQDVSALTGAIDARSDGLTGVVVALTTLGSTAAMAVLAIVAGLVLWARRRWVDGLFLIGTMATAAGVFTLVKNILDRPRPPVADRLLPVTNESLPSGHATMSVAVIGALVVLAWPVLTAGLRVAAVVVAGSWIAAVGVTRIYLGVHWFSDVLAGWATGAAWLAVCTTVLVLHRRRTAAVPAV